MIRILLFLLIISISHAQEVTSVPEPTKTPIAPPPEIPSIPTPTPSTKSIDDPTLISSHTNTTVYNMAISQRIPQLGLSAAAMLANLNMTVWMTSNIRKKIDFYIFFSENGQGSAAVPRSQTPISPARFYPMKFIQAGNEPNSAIILVSSDNRLLYYSFRLITPYNLAISAGYNTVDPLLNWTIEDYFANGYILQLVY